MYLQNNISLIAFSMYRPPNRNLEYLYNMCLTLSEVAENHPNCTIWIGGDLNVPNTNWPTSTLLNHNYAAELCNLIIDTFCSAGLFQMVSFPTRQNNGQDIFVTNRPDLVTKKINVFQFPV